ncbi:hypothetical protein [Enterococcus sp. AZ109]|uniref:hypothetical protein n=1 Tax=Enterococcus sp. AZ109 TaxID=2774634 RepID=UPI003F26EEAF
MDKKMNRLILALAILVLSGCATESRETQDTTKETATVSMGSTKKSSSQLEKENLTTSSVSQVGQSDEGLSEEYIDRIVQVMNSGLSDIENYSPAVLVKKVEGRYEHSAGAFWGLMPLIFDTTDNSVRYDTEEILNQGETENAPLGYWRENSEGLIEFSKDSSWSKVYTETASGSTSSIATDWKNFVGTDKYYEELGEPNPAAELQWSPAFVQAVSDEQIIESAKDLGINQTPTHEQMIQLAKVVALSAAPASNYEALIKQQNPDVQISRIENTGSTTIDGMPTYQLYITLDGKEYLHVNFSPVNGWQHA